MLSFGPCRDQSLIGQHLSRRSGGRNGEPLLSGPHVSGAGAEPLNVYLHNRDREMRSQGRGEFYVCTVHPPPSHTQIWTGFSAVSTSAPQADSRVVRVCGWPAGWLLPARHAAGGCFGDVRPCSDRIAASPGTRSAGGRLAVSGCDVENTAVAPDTLPLLCCACGV